jgi:hypothetical protein
MHISARLVAVRGLATKDSKSAPALVLEALSFAVGKTGSNSFVDHPFDSAADQASRRRVEKRGGWGTGEDSI